MASFSLPALKYALTLFLPLLAPSLPPSPPLPSSLVTISILLPPSSSLELLSLLRKALDLILLACFLDSFSVPASTLSAFFLAFRWALVSLPPFLGSLTLFLCVSIIDRYLEKRTTARRHLQLVGVTALLIAAKFEEQYPPQIHDFVYVTDKAYSKDEVIKMEVSMLTALDFKVCLATPMHFLERYQIVNGCTDAHRDLTNYLLELTLVDYKMVKYNPSHLAAAAVLLSNKLLRRTPSWSGAAVRHTQMTEQTLKECAKEMCGILEHAESHALQAVRKKYSQLKHHAVAKLNFSSTSGSTLAEDARRAARRSTQRRGSAPMELTPAPAAGSTLRQSGQDSTSLLSECGMMA